MGGKAKRRVIAMGSTADERRQKNSVQRKEHVGPEKDGTDVSDSVTHVRGEF